MSLFRFVPGGPTSGTGASTADHGHELRSPVERHGRDGPSRPVSFDRVAKDDKQKRIP